MVKNLTKKEFKNLVFEYDTEKEWKFKGNKPSITEFWAPWCGPCKMISPILEDLSKEFEGKVDIYKINVDDEYELSNTFGIKSIPSILFIPVDGQPQMSTGAMSKENFKNAISEIFNIK